MNLSYRPFRLRSVAMAAVLACTVAQTVLAAAATISLGRDPEPPFCVSNNGGQVQITWNIEHSTTPARVEFILEDPTRTIVLDSQTYDLASGITIDRTWDVPVGTERGKYWVRVEYWSFEASNEANAEVSFNVCREPFGQACLEKREDSNCNGILDDDDQPVEGWYLCLDTPFGGTICRQTDANGEVCLEGIPSGDYRIYEILQDGWVSVSDSEIFATIDSSADQTFTFLNAQYDVCMGACCEGGVCSEGYEADCGLTGAGTFLGLGTRCSSTDCAVPIEQKSWSTIKSIFE